MGWWIDWSRELSTHDPRYYRWQQWQFLRFLERGLAYRKGAPVKWCPNDQTVLANEQVLPDARLLAETPLPVCLANIQPVPSVTPAWDMADLTYNQGIHGIQDTANAMVRSGRPFHVVTDDWRSDAFVEADRRLGARGGGDHPLALAAGRGLRLRDERHGRHPCGRSHAAAHARPAGRLAGPRRPRARGRRGIGRRRPGADRGRRRPVRGRSGAERRRARRPRAHATRTRAATRRGRLRRLLHPLRRDRRGRPLCAAAARRGLVVDGGRLRLRRRGRRPRPPR